MWRLEMPEGSPRRRSARPCPVASCLGVFVWIVFPIRGESFQMSKKGVYLFREGNATMRDLLGGKGANLAEMTNIGLPVPPGFTITTEMCNEYIWSGKMPDGLWEQVIAALRGVEGDMGKKLGDASNP